jgi:hypothetical protein
MPLVYLLYTGHAAEKGDPKIALIMVYSWLPIHDGGKESLWVQASVNALGSFGQFL